MQQATAFLSAIKPTELQPHPLRKPTQSRSTSSDSDTLSGGAARSSEVLGEDSAQLEPPGLRNAFAEETFRSSLLRKPLSQCTTAKTLPPEEPQGRSRTASGTGASATDDAYGGEDAYPAHLPSKGNTAATAGRTIPPKAAFAPSGDYSPFVGDEAASPFGLSTKFPHRRRQTFPEDLSLRYRRQEEFLKSLGTLMKASKGNRRHSSSSSSSTTSTRTSSSRSSSRSQSSGNGNLKENESLARPANADKVFCLNGASDDAICEGAAGDAVPPQHQGQRHRSGACVGGGKLPLRVNQLVQKEGQRVRLRWVYRDPPVRPAAATSSSATSSSSSTELHRNCMDQLSKRVICDPLAAQGNTVSQANGDAAALGAMDAECKGTPLLVSSAGQTQARSSSSSSSSTSSSSASRDTLRRRRQRWRARERLWWAQSAATPMALCTILTRFEPRITTFWKENQVVQPYRGELNASSKSNSSSRSSSSSKDRTTSSSSSSSSSRGSDLTATHACSAPDGEYQDFVVNSQYLTGHYADRSHIAGMMSVADSSTSSSPSGLKADSSLSSSARLDSGDDGRSRHGSGSPTHSHSSSSSRNGSHRSSRRKRGASSTRSHSSRESSRSSSRSSSSSRHSSNARHHHHRRHHHNRGKGGIISGEDNIRSYRKVLVRLQSSKNPAFSNAYFLDTGNITSGERRRKMISLPSYRVSMISFVDKKILKKDLNHNFYVQHPELEIREIKLTHLRKIKNELLVYALEDNALLDLTTVAYAYWYFERLIVQGMVGKRNRKVIMASCVLLAIKFLETGDITKKIIYFKNRWRRFHNVSSVHVGNVNAMLGGGGGAKEAEEDDEDMVHVDWKQVEKQEFPVYVGLDFTLLPDGDGQVIRTHIERLLQLINVTSQEYYSRKFVSPAYLNNYNYYSNLYY